MGVDHDGENGERERILPWRVKKENGADVGPRQECDHEHSDSGRGYGRGYGDSLRTILGREMSAIEFEAALRRFGEADVSLGSGNLDPAFCPTNGMGPVPAFGVGGRQGG